MSFLQELQRRNVFKVAVAYVLVAWLLLQVSDTLAPALHLPEWFHSGVAFILIIGFPVALVLAWAFELTPEGIKSATAVDPGGSSREPARALNYVIVAAFVLLLCWLAWEKFAPVSPEQSATARTEAATPTPAGRDPETAGGTQQKSIAVLPFDDLSPDRDQAYFGEGIAEELLNLLAHVGELRVAGRTSSFTVAGRDLTIPEIASTLNVGHVLEGSVRKSGNQLRITVQLIEARSDTHLWSQTFDREFADIFAIQDEIAAAVVNKLQITLLDGTPHTRQVDPEAYALYLQARNLFYNQSEPADFERSGELYRQAMERDPDFIDAISGYARYLLLSEETLPDETGNRGRVRRMIDRALAIDPNHPMMLSWRSFLAMSVENDLGTAARYLERAFESDNTHYDLLWGSILNLPGFGRSDLAAQVGEYLLARDPLCQSCRDATARAYRNIGNFERSIELLRAGLELNPDWWPGSFGLTLSLVYAGRPEEALQNATALDELAGARGVDGTLPGHLEALHDLGMMEEFDALLPGYTEIHAQDYPGYMAQLYAWVGQVDEAFTWLERIDRAESYGIRSTLARFPFRKLREDPRMQALLEQYQLTDEQVKAVGLDLELPRLGR